MKSTLVGSVALAVLCFYGSIPALGDEAPITVNCACQTKKNPSWCAMKTGDFETIHWSQSGFQKPGGPLDKQALALFCQRHADAACQCSDQKHFSGTIAK